MLGKGKSFLLLIRHPPCYTYSQEVFDTTTCTQTQITNNWKYKDEPNIVYMGKSQRASRDGTKNVQTNNRANSWTALYINKNK